MSEYVATLLLLQNKKVNLKTAAKLSSAVSWRFPRQRKLTKQILIFFSNPCETHTQTAKDGKAKSRKKNFSDTNTNQMFFLDKNRTM